MAARSGLRPDQRRDPLWKTPASSASPNTIDAYQGTGPSALAPAIRDVYMPDVRETAASAVRRDGWSARLGQPADRRSGISHNALMPPYRSSNADIQERSGSSDLLLWHPMNLEQPLATSSQSGGPPAPSSHVGRHSLSSPLEYEDWPLSSSMDVDRDTSRHGMPAPQATQRSHTWSTGSSGMRSPLEHPQGAGVLHGRPGNIRSSTMSHHQRKPANRDEFDGPHQFLEPPPSDRIAARDQDLPHVPTNLLVQEQDEVLAQVHDRLSQCAFDFVAKYQFPIPLEPDKRPVRVAADREWNEWVQLLRRLATKRRIPARVLYNGQIKQLVTILENSLEMRHAAKHQSRPLKDDRNILQLISAGIQVAKILKDAAVMHALDDLYVRTEAVIRARMSPLANRR